MEGIKRRSWRWWRRKIVKKLVFSYLNVIFKAFSEHEWLVMRILRLNACSKTHAFLTISCILRGFLRNACICMHFSTIHALCMHFWEIYAFFMYFACIAECQNAWVVGKVHVFFPYIPCIKLTTTILSTFLGHFWVFIQET